MKAPKFLKKVIGGTVERVLNASYLAYVRSAGKPLMEKEMFLSTVEEILRSNEA